MTLHACELRDPILAPDIPEHVPCSDGAGIVFVRDADGYGHWLCSRHARQMRELWHGIRA